MTKTNAPRLRFKEFDGEWKEEYLKDISEIKNGVTGDINLQDSDFKITRIETISNGFIDEDKLGYIDGNPGKDKLLKFGDILYSNINSIDHIGKTAIFHSSSKIYHGINLTRIIINNFNDPFFINYLLNTDNYRVWSKRHANQAVSQASINNKDLGKMDLFLPQKEEQTKISSFFIKLDKLIELQTKKLQQLNKLKKGYLQKMFPQDGESVPRLRFSGFSGEWKEEKLKETLKVGKSGGTPSTKNKEYYNGTIPFLSIKDVTESNGIIDDTEKHINNDAIQNSSSWIVPKGSLTISMYASVGSVAKFSSDVATSQAFFNMIFKDGINVDFMYHFFNQYNLMGRWKRLIATGTQGNLNATEINNILVRIPSEIEQRKIAFFLSKLDQMINNQSDKISALQQEKKSYLQKMFI